MLPMCLWVIHERACVTNVPVWVSYQCACVTIVPVGKLRVYWCSECARG